MTEVTVRRPWMTELKAPDGTVLKISPTDARPRIYANDFEERVGEHLRDLAIASGRRLLSASRYEFPFWRRLVLHELLPNGIGIIHTRSKWDSDWGINLTHLHSFVGVDVRVVVDGPHAESEEWLRAYGPHASSAPMPNAWAKEKINARSRSLILGASWEPYFADRVGPYSLLPVKGLVPLERAPQARFYAPLVRNYIPDFILPNGVILEVKDGVTPGEAGNKLLWVRHTNPWFDVRVVLSDRAVEAGRWVKWCEKHQLPWTSHPATKDLADWFNEPDRPMMLERIKGHLGGFHRRYGMVKQQQWEPQLGWENADQEAYWVPDQEETASTPMLSVFPENPDAVEYASAAVVI